MRLYLDLNCFNRPFDDQSQERIHRETEAVLAILGRIVERTDTLVWSWALDWENARHPIADRREEIGLWRYQAAEMVELTPALQARTRQIHVYGIPPLDASHLASAEAGGTEAFLSCDDALVNRIRQARVASQTSGPISLPFRVMNPVEYWEEVKRHGRAVDRE